MVLTEFFHAEISSELWKMLVSISRKALRCKSSAKSLISYVHELLPTIEEIKYSGVELPAPRQSQLDRLSEILRSGVELSHQALSSSRWNVYRNFQLAKKMEKLEKHVTRFLQVGVFMVLRQLDQGFKYLDFVAFDDITGKCG